MGVRESVGELEAAMSELNEEKAESKAKKTRETAVREDRLGGMEVRIGDIEGGIAELQKNFVALQKKISVLEIAKEKSGAGGYAAVEKRIREMESRVVSARPPAAGKDYSADIAELRKSVSEIRNIIASGAAKSGEPAKDLLELKSRMDVLQKYVDGKISSMDRIVEDRLRNISSGDKEIESVKKIFEDMRRADGRKIEELSKAYEGKIKELEKKQSDIMSKTDERVLDRLKETIQHSVAGFKSGVERHIDDAVKKMDDNSENIRKRQDEAEKRIEERQVSIRSDTSKMVSEALRNIPKRDDIRKDVEEKINGKLAEFSKKVDEVSRYDLGKLKNVTDAEKRIDDRLKLFALNSDLEKAWRETESLKKYIDEKSRYADALANSLRSWETRSMELAAREHDFDEKIKAFPELKLMDSRIRKMERAIADLQRHFVAAKIAEPIIME